MSSKAPRLRRVTERELETIISFLKRLGAPTIKFNLYALEVPGGAYLDVFDVPFQTERVLEGIKSAYAAGFYIGSIGPEDSFKPSLPLAQRLARLCETSVTCIRLDMRGSKLFLYGKVVPEEHIVEFNENVTAVLDPLGEALGWGQGRYVELKNRRTKEVKPVKDLGWYLRRGG